MTDHLMQILQAVGVVISAIMALIAAIKGNQAHTEAKAARTAAEAAAASAAPGTVLPPGISLWDIMRYQQTITELLAVVKSIGRLSLHEATPLPKTVFDLPGGERIELAPTTATRTR